MAPYRPARRAGVAGMTVALLASSALASAPAALADDAVASQTATQSAAPAEGDAVLEVDTASLVAANPWLASQLLDGPVTLQITGTFDTTGAQALLEQINAVRAQAASEGRTLWGGQKVEGTPLTWSNELERIAQTRVVEASVMFSHQRPDGSPVVFDKENGNAFRVEILDENLAVGASTADAFATWCAEKDAYDVYERETGIDTGDFSRYATLLSEDSRYVGIASFTPTGYSFDEGETWVPLDDSGIVPGTGGVAGTVAPGSTVLVALFSSTAATDDTPAAPDGTTVQSVTLQADDHFTGSISGDTTIYMTVPAQLTGNVESVETRTGVVKGDVSNLLDLAWVSGDENIATVDETGTVSGVSTGPVSIALTCGGVVLATYDVTVVPAPVIEAVGALDAVATASGTAPELPATISATWTHGAVTNEAITWDDIDPALWSAREGGSFTATGTVEGWDREIAVAVDVAAAVAVEASAQGVSTPSGTAPELPATAAVTWSNGDVTNEAASWDPVDADAYMARAGGTLEVAGTVEATGQAVTCTVEVEPATVVGAVSEPCATEALIAPVLPATATVTWSNGDSTTEEVRWDDPDAKLYAQPGSLEAQGTTAETGTPVTCAVEVLAPTAVSAVDPAGVTTPSGTAPQLPATVQVTWSNGTVTDEKATWSPIDASAYAMREGGAFEVGGIVEVEGGTREGTASFDAVCAVTVEPATATKVDQPSVVTTPSGTQPELPATAEVTWSNGDVTQEEVSWETPDKDAYSDRAGATLEVDGVVGTTGQAVSAAVTVEPATAEGVAEPAGVSTPSGTAPELPATAEVTWSNGDVTQEPVAWETPGEDAWSTREGAALQVDGTVETTGQAVSAAVEVQPATIVGVEAPAGVSTSADSTPELPKTMAVTWSNGDVTQEPVSWEAPAADAYADHAGSTLQVNGTIEGWADPVALPVEVAAAPASTTKPASVTEPASTAEPASTTEPASKAAEPSVASVAPLTLEAAGDTAGKLPAIVEVAWDDGSVTQEPVTWEPLDAGVLTGREGGTFEVAGTLDATGAAVSTTVEVPPATADQATLAATEVETPVGAAPKLPATAEVTWSNGDVTQEPVTWDDVDPARYGEPGSFEVHGTVADADVTCTVSVPEPVAVSAAAPATVQTPAGSAPELPATAEVTWDNGSVTQEPVVWETPDETAWSAREGATLEVGGTVETTGQAVSATVEVAPATIASVAEPAAVSTPAGIAPELPTTVEVTWSNGDVTQEPVSWDDEAALYAATGTATVTGTVANGTAAVEASVAVEAPVAVGIADIAAVTTVAGTKPALPTSVSIKMSDGTQTTTSVTWDDVERASYSAAGSFTVAGTVDVTGEHVEVAVDVAAPIPTQIQSPSVRADAGQEPALPKTVRFTWSDGTTTNEAVTWDAEALLARDEPGTYGLHGTAAGRDVTANLTVREPLSTPAGQEGAADATGRATADVGIVAAIAAALAAVVAAAVALFRRLTSRSK